MRALSALILSTALALPLASTAFAEDAVRSISVTGTGTIEAAPDMATLMIGVTTQGKTAAEALAENSKATDAVIARLTASGIAARGVPDPAGSHHASAQSLASPIRVCRPLRVFRSGCAGLWW